MADDVLICRCEGVTQDEILEAIRDGATTLTGVKRRTRACMGFCQGKTCQTLVRRIVGRETGQEPGEIPPSTVRPPVRPLLLPNQEPLPPGEGGGEG